MKIVSWNVNGIRAAVKKNFINEVIESGADIYCVQETKAQVDQVETALAELDGYHLYSNAAERKGYSGVSIFTKEAPINVMKDIGISEHDQEGRVLALEYDQFYMVNVYVPNSGSGLKRLDYRSTWDKDFGDYLAKLRQDKPVIITGDFNVAHSAIDLKNDKSNYNKTAGYTQTEIDGLDYILNKGFNQILQYVSTKGHHYEITLKQSRKHLLLVQEH
ncbi:unnamed protein product, partial [Cyprideis torosa]